MTENIAQDLVDVQAVLTTLSLPKEASPAYWRTTALVDPLADAFRIAAQLVWASPPTDFDVGQPHTGDELVYLGFADEPGHLRRRRVRRADGGTMDEIQQRFLLAFQRALLTTLGSLARDPERIVTFVASRLIDHAVAGVAAGEAGTDRDVALTFHQQLLSTLRDMLLSAYEGKSATIAVAVVPDDGATLKEIRWTKHAQNALPFLLTAKIARVLSNGIDPVFVFAASGEFLGLKKRSELMNSIPNTSRVVEWQIRHPQTLRLSMKGRRVFELFGGAWRYIDDRGALDALKGAEPSFGGANSCLWDLAIRLSDERYGGLILVVQYVDAFRKAGCCKPEEFNLPGEPPRLERTRPGSPEAAGAVNERVVDLPSLKEILLEQYRDAKVADLGVELLLRLARVDGALIVLPSGHLCGFGVIMSLQGKGTQIVEGARTLAATLASDFGVALKISADGPISIYRGGDVIFPGS